MSRRRRYVVRDTLERHAGLMYVKDEGELGEFWGGREEARVFTESEVVAFLAAYDPNDWATPINVVAEPANG